MKRNFKKAAVGLVALSMVAAACGGDDDTTEPTDAPTDEPTATTAAGDEPAGTSLINGEIPCEQQYAGKTVTHLLAGPQQRHRPGDPPTSSPATTRSSSAPASRSTSRAPTSSRPRSTSAWRAATRPTWSTTRSRA